MKIIIWFVVGLLTLFYAYLVNNSMSSNWSNLNDLPSGLARLSMEIGCHTRFPLSEKCIKSILRPCDSDRVPDRVTYAWRKWGDINFLLTVDAESRFDENAVGDKIGGEYLAFGFCQVRKDKNRWGYDRYRAMATWQERLEECHRMYSEWKRKGIVANRLYGYRVRHLNKSNIKCYG